MSDLLPMSPMSRYWSKAWMVDAFKRNGYAIEITKVEAWSYSCTVLRDGRVVSVHEGGSRQDALSNAYDAVLRPK